MSLNPDAIPCKFRGCVLDDKVLSYTKDKVPETAAEEGASHIVSHKANPLMPLSVAPFTPSRTRPTC